MKKMLVVMMFVIIATTQMFAMSTSHIRNHARFLSDRMAYELDLTPFQYDDVYEINFDFIYSVNRIMDDVVYGYHDAIENYYRMLDYRNEDLRFVLNARQYARFLASDYFYRPIYSNGRDWHFHIYTIYSNRTFFYFDAPSVYRHYNGGHSHVHYNHNYYNTRHHHDAYGNASHIHGSQHYQEHGRNDFGVNRRERGNNKHNEINNYKNHNQKNRTEDHRYRDNSGNHNSPQINHRGENHDNRKPQGGENTKPQRGNNAKPQNGNTPRQQGGSTSRAQGNTPNPQRGNSGTTHSGRR